MTATFTEAVDSHINSALSLLSTAIPAKILEYNPSTQKAVVQPLVEVLLKDNRQIPYPELEDVPVVFPSTSNSMLSFPININDTVLLIFSQRSIDTWLVSNSTETVNPQDFRKHDYSDAIAIPGLFSFPRAINEPKKHTLTHNTGDLVVAHNIGGSTENEIRLKADGSIRMSAGANTKLTLNLDGSVVLDAPTSLTVTAPVTTWIGDINQQGTFTSDTDVVANGTSLDTHTHSGVQTGGGSTGAPN
jgi:hypothetical protein